MTRYEDIDVAKEQISDLEIQGIPFRSVREQESSIERFYCTRKNTLRVRRSCGSEKM
jgi:hypothetical protein